MRGKAYCWYQLCFLYLHSKVSGQDFKSFWISVTLPVHAGNTTQALRNASKEYHNQ